LVTGTEAQVVGGLATRSILNYRTSALVNDWRFTNLQAAQKSLRNTSFALGLLVLLALLLLLYPATPKSTDPAGEIKKLQQSLDDLGSRIDRQANDAAHVSQSLAAIHQSVATLPEINRQLDYIKSTLDHILTRLPMETQRTSEPPQTGF
jgi:hypothetical protein